MGVSYKVADWLNSIAHNAAHLNDEGLHTLKDNLILEKAIAEKRIILTSDMDFGHLLSFTKSHNVSVIQFRMHDLSPRNVISKLQIIIDKFKNELEGEFVLITVQDNKLRLKHLPI